MKSYYVMNRSGEFEPIRPTSNQCKEPGHLRYGYELRMCFFGAMQLDQNQFILDHQLVDDLVQSLALTGSCEEMHKLISRQLRTMMTRKNIELAACKCTIKPKPDGPAFLEFITLNELASPHLLSLVA